MKETDLYQPLRTYLEHQGYRVHSEVRNCDIVAIKDEEVVIIEMKTSFSVSLLIQAADRKEITDSVYVAIPVRIGRNRPANFRGMKLLLRRLEVGLILVNFMKTKTKVEIAFHPQDAATVKKHRKKRAIIHEIDGRYAEFNTAGSPVTQERVSAYKQSSIRIAYYLDMMGTASPKELRQRGVNGKTQRILSNNIYGWFNRVQRGTYTLNDYGRKALSRYSNVVNVFRECEDESWKM